MVTQRLTRSSSDKVIAGVCAGIGQYFGIDAVIVRLIMVALVFAGGITVLLYPILWLVMPTDGMGQATLREGLQDIQRQAQAFGQQASQTVQSSFATPRYDPQTGQPLHTAQAERRNRMLGFALVGLGTMMLASFFGGGQLAMALIILGGGAYLLRQSK
jgi:phage shock protein C